MESIIAKTEAQQGMQLSSKDTHQKKQSKKKSIYVNEDSDEEYEYNENDDYDDHYDHLRTNCGSSTTIYYVNTYQ